jgi:hypothetical protein
MQKKILEIGLAFVLVSTLQLKAQKDRFFIQPSIAITHRPSHTKCLMNLSCWKFYGLSSCLRNPDYILGLISNHP